MCGEQLIAKNLKRHKERKHSEHFLRPFDGICVDFKEAIYLIVKGLGNPQPIHVQQKTEGIVTHTYCSVEECRDAVIAANRGGIGAIQCHHIMSVSNATPFPQNQRKLLRRTFR